MKGFKSCDGHGCLNRVWNSIVAPDVKKWLEIMSEIASYTCMLARINNEEEPGIGTYFFVERAYGKIIDGKC